MTERETERQRKLRGLRIEVDDTLKARDENRNTDTGRKRLVRRRQIDGLW